MPKSKTKPYVPQSPSQNAFQVGEHVRLRMPMMSRQEGKISKTGYILKIDGSYIAVRPSHWPKGRFIEFYPNELERFKTNVKRSEQARKRARSRAASARPRARARAGSARGR